jgi:hypothetical protein
MENSNHYFSLCLTLMVFLVGLVAFVGGIQGKPNPFFWLKNYKSIHLKTSTHYVVFGLVALVAALFFAYRILIAMGLF